MSTGRTSTPQIIWIYWDRGLVSAPPLVKTCVESWRVQNPDWDVRLLDAENLRDTVDMSDVVSANPQLTIQAFADILRWRLIARYGGVWADATLYCNKPLSDWLPDMKKRSDLFMFRNSETFLIHSWFIAGSQKSLIVYEMDSELDRFFLRYGGFRHYWELRGIWRIYSFLEKRIGSGNYSLWRSTFVRKYLKAAPYFFQNYLIGGIISRDHACKDEFLRMSDEYGEGPHTIQEETTRGTLLSREKLQSILDSQCPVFKLTNKHYAAEWEAAHLLSVLADHTAAGAALG